MSIALAGIAWMAWNAHSRKTESEGTTAVEDVAQPMETERSVAPTPVVPTAPRDRPVVQPAVPTAANIPSVQAAPSAAIGTTPAPTGTPSGVDEHPDLDAVLDQIEFPEGDAGTPGQQLHRATENYQRLRARMSEMDQSLQTAERSGDTAAQQRIITRFRRMRNVMLALQSESNELREQGAVDPTAGDAASPASHGG